MSFYAEKILATSGLLSYWKLGESSGSSATDSNGSETLTYTGATVGQTGYSNIGLAPSFSKSSLPSNVLRTYAKDAATPNYTVNWTWECWVFLNSYNATAGQSGLFTWSTANVWTRLLEVASNGAVTMGYSETPTAAATFVSHTLAGNAGDVPTSAWTHVAATYDNTSKVMKTYVNGANVKTSSAQTNSPDTTYISDRKLQNASASGDNGNAELALTGRFIVANDWGLDGKMQHSAVYNTALSAATLLDHFNTAKADPGHPAGASKSSQVVLTRAGSW